MQGAGTITVILGGLPVLAAWLLELAGLSASYRSVTDVLAEVACVLLLVLAWRFRRGRLAAASLMLAATNWLVRGPLASNPAAVGWTVLAYLAPAGLVVLALMPERPIRQPPVVALISVTIATAVVIGSLLPATGSPTPPESAASLFEILKTPEVARIAFLIAAAFAALAFAARRGAFEGSLLWVVVATALALLGSRNPHAATLALTAGQVVLLLGLSEDSYRLAYQDELTGLPSRRAFEEALPQLNGTYTLAMVDIDHFKRFNDRHGHAAGDQALRMVASELARISAGGKPYRYGGEEFAIVFPATTVADARQALDSVRQAISDRRFAIRAPDRPRRKPSKPRANKKPRSLISLTVSIGLAASGPQRFTPEAVLRSADRALYRAKKAGRNRIIATGDRTT
ncbi:MAG: GGDEF domain-containing protein [Holophagae bacterium]